MVRLLSLLLRLSVSLSALCAAAPLRAEPTKVIAVAFDIHASDTFSAEFSQKAFAGALVGALEQGAPGVFTVLDPVTHAEDARSAQLVGRPADPDKLLTDLGTAGLVVAELHTVGDALVLRWSVYLPGRKGPVAALFVEDRAIERPGLLLRAASGAGTVILSDGKSKPIALHKAVAQRVVPVSADFPTQNMQVNVSLEAALERALDAEKAGKPVAELARIWCDLASLAVGSSYVPRLKQQCAQDTLFVELVAARERDRKEDFRLVEELVGLKRRSVDEKKTVLTAFVDAYRGPDSSEVRDADQALALLGRGLEPDLADADKDGVRFDSCPDVAEDRDGTEDADGCPEDTADEQLRRSEAEKERVAQQEREARAAEEREAEEFVDGLFAVTLLDFEFVEWGLYGQALTAVPAPETLTVPVAFGLRGALAGFDLALGITTTRHAPDFVDEIFLHSSVGVFPFRAPAGAFTLLRPEVAIEYLGNPFDAATASAFAVNLSNDLSLSPVHVRPFYRFAFMRSGGFPAHQVGVELFVDLADLDDLGCFELCD